MTPYQWMLGIVFVLVYGTAGVVLGMMAWDHFRTRPRGRHR